MILDKLLQCWQRKLSHCELRIQLLECFCGSDLSLQLLGNVPLHRGFAGLSIHMQCLHHVCTMVPACFNSIDMTGEVLNWGMIIAASMRSTLQASMETNEVGMLTELGSWMYIPVMSCNALRLRRFSTWGDFLIHGQSVAINAELVCDTTTPFLFLHQSHGGGRGFLNVFFPSKCCLDHRLTLYTFWLLPSDYDAKFGAQKNRKIGTIFRYISVFQLFESSLLGSMGFPQPTANLLNTWWRGLLALPFLWCRCDLWAPLRIELLSHDEVLRFVRRGWKCGRATRRSLIHWSFVDRSSYFPPLFPPLWRYKSCNRSVKPHLWFMTSRCSSADQCDQYPRWRAGFDIYLPGEILDPPADSRRVWRCTKFFQIWHDGRCEFHWISILG